MIKFGPGNLRIPKFEKPVYEGTGVVLTGRVESVSTSTGLLDVSWEMADQTGHVVQRGTARCLLKPAGA